MIHAHVRDLFEQRRFTLIAGPCVVESYDICKQIAMHVAERARAYNVSYIFKASFDKANRTSIASFRGHGAEEGLETLARIRDDVGVPVVTDIHLPEQAALAARYVDVLQIPAFLCRQTDLLLAASATGLPTHIKKAQFAAPEDMVHAVRKFREGGGKAVALTERGTTFGYHNLVVDFRGLPIMRELAQVPVIFDATHSIQRPSAANGKSSGDRTQAVILARAAAAVGIDGLFCEVHPDPDHALSDGPNSFNYLLLEQTLKQVTAIQKALM